MKDDDASDLEQLMQTPEEDLKQRFVASVVDEEGREIPITKAMVQDACSALEQEAITGLHCPHQTGPAQ